MVLKYCSQAKKDRQSGRWLRSGRQRPPHFACQILGGRVSNALIATAQEECNSSNTANLPAKNMSTFTVLIPVDGSENSDNAFECKYRISLLINAL